MTKQSCYQGIRIYHITFCYPSIFTISDAWEYGMRGFCSEGFAWRFKLPSHLIERFSINLLEFIAARITIKMTLLLLNLESLPNGIHICGFTDSSSALGWMHHSTFDPVKYPSHDIVARQLAMDLISSRSSLFS